MSIEALKVWIDGFLDLYNTPANEEELVLGLVMYSCKGLIEEVEMSRNIQNIGHSVKRVKIGGN